MEYLAWFGILAVGGLLVAVFLPAILVLLLIGLVLVNPVVGLLVLILLAIVNRD